MSTALRIYFGDGWIGQGGKLNDRQVERTGLYLRDKEVRRLEIQQAVERLQREAPDLAMLVDYHFARGWKREQVEERFAITKNTFFTRLNRALSLLVEYIGEVP